MTKVESELTDEQLIAKILTEDKEYFGEIIVRYRDKLMRYMRRITNVDSAGAEDILQDAFIKIYKNLNDFDTELKFSSWVYRIVHNEVISTHRKNTSGIHKVSISIDEYELQNIIKDDFDITLTGEARLTKQYIQEALARIDGKYREVLILKYFEYKDYKEIADILKKPMGTIATLLNRAKKQLRKEINIISKNAYENE